MMYLWSLVCSSPRRSATDRRGREVVPGYVERAQRPVASDGGEGRNGVEGRGANSHAAILPMHRRSDIRLATGGFNVPVEIKLDSSTQLWTGLRDQLVGTDGYVRDPGAGGRGIYVVIWFGEHEAVHPETHEPIDGPQSIRDVLESMLTSDEQCTVAVRVIDVSRA